MRLFMTLAVVAVALGLAAVAGAEQRFTDATGDSGAAPDLGQFVVTNDSNQVVIEISAPARLPQPEEAYLLEIDTDANGSTGKDGFEVHVFAMSLSSSVEVWNGSDWVAAPPTGISVRFEFSATTGLWRVTLPRTLLSNTSAFTFRTLAAKFSGENVVGLDAAPDGGAWRYELALKQCANGRDDDGDGKVDSSDLGCSGTEDDLESDDPYTLSIGRATATPASAKPGKPVVVRARVRQAETSQAIQTGSVRCMSKVGSTTKRSTGQLKAGTAMCRLMAPKVAKPSSVRGTITVTSKSASISAPFSYRVR